MIPTGKKGIILSSSDEFVGWEICVQDDTKGSTGGYYILYNKGKEGCDFWVENREVLEYYFESDHYIVKWED